MQRKSEADHGAMVGHSQIDPTRAAGPARSLQAAIKGSPRAMKKGFAYLDALGEPHSGLISGATLAAVCGVDSRTWRKWVGGEREMPLSAQRLLRIVGGV